MASLLDPVQIAEIVQDPYERAYLNRLRPEAATATAHPTRRGALLQKIMTADDPDEIRWLRSSLLIGLVPGPSPAPGTDGPDSSGSHPSRSPARRGNRLRSAVRDRAGTDPPGRRTTTAEGTEEA